MTFFERRKTTLLQDYLGKGSRVEISNRKPLSMGGYGRIYQVVAGVFLGDKRSRKIILVEKRPYQAIGYQMSYRYYLDIHRILKANHIPTFPTLRMNDQDIIYTTPLNRCGRVAVSANNKLPQHDIDGYPIAIDRIVITNNDNLRSQMEDIAQKAVKAGLELDYDAPFFILDLLNSDASTRQAKVSLMIGDFDRVIEIKATTRSGLSTNLYNTNLTALLNAWQIVVRKYRLIISEPDK